MSKRIKQVLLFVLLAFALLALTGCHGKVAAKGFVVPDAFDETKEYHITFWAKNDTNVTQVRIYQSAIEQFEALYPHIKVTLRLYTDYGQIYNDVITNISTGTTPNVCISYPDHIATYLNGENVVVPLTNLLTDPSYGLGGDKLPFASPAYDRVIPQYLTECAFGGQTYAIPFMRSTEACYINKDLVSKLGYAIPDVLTWDFVWEVSEKAMEKDADGNFKVNGQKVLIPFIYKSTDNMMIQMLRQQNIPYSTDGGDIRLFNNQTKAVLETIASHAKTGAFSTFKISSYPGNFLNAGQCIFAVDSTAGATWMGSKAPLSDIHDDKKVSFETVVTLVPQFDAASPQMISQGPSLCVFNKEDPQEVLASWLFAQYLLTNDVQIAYAQTEGYTPVTMDAREDARYLDYLSRAGEDNNAYYDVKIKATKLLLENTQNTFVTPVFSGSASLRDAAGQLIEDVTKAVRRKKTVDGAYIDNLYKDVSALYHLDRAAAAGESGAAPLPAMSKALLFGIAAVWVALGAAVLTRFVKSRRDQRR